ncbi:hypothetical protein ACP4OV_014924 [Aristida adscensionis]
MKTEEPVVVSRGDGSSSCSEVKSPARRALYASLPLVDGDCGSAARARERWRQILERGSGWRQICARGANFRCYLPQIPHLKIFRIRLLGLPAEAAIAPSGRSGTRRQRQLESEGCSDSWRAKGAMSATAWQQTTVAARHWKDTAAVPASGAGSIGGGLVADSIASSIDGIHGYNGIPTTIGAYPPVPLSNFSRGSAGASQVSPPLAALFGQGAGGSPLQHTFMHEASDPGTWDDIVNIMQACVILHNMIVEDEKELVRIHLDLNDNLSGSIILPPERYGNRQN